MGLKAIFDRPAQTKVQAAGNGSNTLVSAGANALLGCSVRESTGAASTAWRLHDGTSAAGPVIAVFGAPASGTGSPVLPTVGVAVASGSIFLENVSGSGEVAIYWA